MNFVKIKEINSYENYYIPLQYFQIDNQSILNEEPNNLISINELDFGSFNSFPNENQIISESTKNQSLNQNIQKNLKKRIRCKDRRRRRENNDNIRKGIKRNFFNRYIYNILNTELKKGGSNNFFEKFSSVFASDIDRERNKALLNITLIQIMKNKDLYKNNSLEKYYHNLEVLKSLKKGKFLDLEKLLNTTYLDLFNEYINSENFENNLKKLKYKENDVYIERYIYLSQTWIDFFLNNLN